MTTVETPAETRCDYCNAPKVAAYTVAQVAELMQLNTKQVYALIHAGRLTAVPCGRHYRIPAHALDRLLHSADAA